MLHDFPAETLIVPEVKKPVALAGFTSEASPVPRASPSVTVGRSSWRRAVAGLCAGTGLAVALALIAPEDSQSAPVSSRSNIPRAAGTAAPTPSLPAQPKMSLMASSPVVPDEIVIRSVLERYRGAYERLDAEAAKMIWPSVDERGLAQAFSHLESQSLRFDHCRIDIDGGRGVATCQGEATYAARAGDRSIRTQMGTWTFELNKNGDDWTIKWVQQSP